MPLKREATKVQKAKTKTEEICQKSSKNYRTSDPDTLIKALKDNNTNLAAALDESRQNFRDLQEDVVVLKQERQQLLERVLRLENKLSDRVKELSQQVHPIVHLLRQSEKNLSVATQTLNTLLTTGCSSELFSPCLSPIHNAAESYYTKPQSSTLIIENDHKQGTHNARRKTYIKTPHPIITASTPVSSEEAENSFLNSVSKALDFDREETESQGAYTPLPTSVEPGDSTRFRATTKLSNIGEEDCTDGHQLDNSCVVMEDIQPASIACKGGSYAHKPTKLPTMKAHSKSKSTTNNNSKAKKVTSKSSTVSSKHSVHSGKEVPASSRPKRNCSTLNTSYQEPSLKVKMRREEKLSTGIKMPKVKLNTTSKTKAPVKHALQDVTNKNAV